MTDDYYRGYPDHYHNDRCEQCGLPMFCDNARCGTDPDEPVCVGHVGEPVEEDA